MSASKILFYLCIAFAAGIFLESLTKIPQIYIWGILILASLAIIVPYILQKYEIFVIFGFCFMLLALGVLRMQIAEFYITQDGLAELNDSGEEIVFEGVVAAEPDVRENSQKLRIKVKNSSILVTTGRYPEYNYADRIKITGKLKTPMETEDFSYKNYLLKDGIYSVMGFPKIEVVPGEEKAGIMQKFYGLILNLKQKMRRNIQLYFSPKTASVVSGIVLGDKSAMPKDLKEKIKISGLSHIIAVSGMHIAIVAAIVMAFLLFLGFHRGRAFYLAVMLIILYVLLVGFPASAVRAGIMGIIYLAAEALGRQAAGSRAITLAAALMLSFNPMYLMYDVGFQLSFLAVVGLIYFEPILRGLAKAGLKRFFSMKIPEKGEKAIMLFSVPLAAQIFTLPLIIYNFGSISYFSLLSNLLVSPIISLLMIFGFLGALAGMIFTGAGWIISLPANFLAEYFLFVVNMFSKPWAHKTIEGVSFVLPVASYIFLVAILRIFKGLRFRIYDF